MSNLNFDIFSTKNHNNPNTNANFEILKELIELKDDDLQLLNCFSPVKSDINELKPNNSIKTISTSDPLINSPAYNNGNYNFQSESTEMVTIDEFDLNQISSLFDIGDSNFTEHSTAFNSKNDVNTSFLQEKANINREISFKNFNDNLKKEREKSVNFLKKSTKLKIKNPEEVIQEPIIKYLTNPTILNKQSLLMPPVLLNRKRIRLRKKAKVNNKKITLWTNKKEATEIQWQGDTFIKLSAEEFNSSNMISIVTYNVLHQSYMKKNDREDLSLENRMSKIISEIENLQADIICLQECDLEIFKQYFSGNYLKEYKFVYGINCGSSWINVTGFIKSKFKMKSFKNFSLLDLNVVGNRGIMNVILENLKSGELISIYNLHLPWRFEYQRCLMIEKAHQHVLQMNIKNTIFVGDFNCEPTSPLIKMFYFKCFLKQNLQQDFFFKHGEEKSGKKVDFQLFQNIHEKYEFKSAYANYLDIVREKKHLNNFKNHPRFTSYTQYFKNNIDYIFYPKGFKLVELLKIPNENLMKKEGFLPSAYFPSDHIKLYAKFKFI
jgi:mRNA deadenylase 3'-5' endonuclease subunit Ccr4